MNEYTTEFFRLAKRNQLSKSENQQVTRYLSGLKHSIRDKIRVQMVFNVQEVRNLAMKAKLLIMEQTRSINYRRYGGVDNKAHVTRKNTCSCVRYYGDCQCWCRKREKCSSGRR